MNFIISWPDYVINVSGFFHDQFLSTIEKRGIQCSYQDTVITNGYHFLTFLVIDYTLVFECGNFTCNSIRALCDFYQILIKHYLIFLLIFKPFLFCFVLFLFYIQP